MSFYRNILAAVAAIAITSPVFAEDTVAAQAAAPAAVTTAATEATPAATTEMASAADTSTTAAASTTATETKVDLNKATAKDLMKVKGIKSSQARAIVAYRKAHGNFKSVEDLANVKGFTKMKSENMKAIADQLSVG